jgi:DNA-binding IclR family transcriptional regulator
MISLASVLLRTSELKAHARPVVRDLAAREGRPVSLVAWDCGRIIYLDRRFDPRQATACGPVAGTAAPLDGSAAAKVLLASRPSDEIETLWDAGRVHTGHASLDELELDLHRIRTHGWAHGVADHALDRRAVAAPVKDREGCVAAAISLDLDGVQAGDVDRLRASDEVDFHVRAVIGAASRISASIRQREPARAATQRKLAQAAN